MKTGLKRNSKREGTEDTDDRQGERWRDGGVKGGGYLPSPTITPDTRNDVCFY